MPSADWLAKNNVTLFLSRSPDAVLVDEKTLIACARKYYTRNAEDALLLADNKAIKLRAL